MANDPKVKVEIEVQKKKDAGKRNGIYEDAKKMQDATKGAAQNAQDILKSLKTAFNTSSVLGWAKIVKDTVNDMLDASKAQTEYIENLNLMQVAFGDSAKSAEAYVESITNAIGFDQSNLTRQLGVFRQISSAMQYTSDVADLLSTNLSKMSLDISSLFNVDVEKAGSALESAITGQVRSIRSLTGADITQATLQQEALALGIEKSVTQMSRAEKTILIYLSLERQLANANGDTARTINSVANQTKIFKDQITIAGRQLGSIFIPILKTLLPILNGILMVFNAIVKTLLSFFGIDTSKMASEFGIASSGLDTIEDGLTGVTKASKDAKKSLRGFDKLNNIVTPTASGTSGGVGGIGSVDKKLLEQLKEYNLQLDEMSNKATEIRDKILEWLGLTIDENGKLSISKITLGGILTTIGLIGGGLITINKISGGLKVVGGILKKIFGAKGTLGAGGEAAASVGTVSKLASAFGFLFKIIAVSLATYEGLKLATEGIAKAIGAIVGYDIDNIGDKLANTSEKTQKSLSGVKEKVDGVASAINNVKWNKVGITAEDKRKISDSIDGLTEEIKAKLEEYVSTTSTQLRELYDNGFISEDEYNKKLEELQTYYDKQLSATKTQNEKLKSEAEGLYDDEGKLNVQKYSDFMRNLNNYETDVLTSMTTDAADRQEIQENANKYSEKEQLRYYSELLTGYAKDRDEAIQKAQEKKDGTINAIKNLYDESDPEYQKLIDQANRTYDEEVGKAKASYDTIYEDLKETTTGMGTWIDQDDGHLKSSWEVVCDEFSSEWKTTWETIWNAATTAGKKISQWWKGLWADKEVRFSANGGKGSSGYSDIIISSRAGGGFVDEGELFISREAGPEMVGTIGNHTAVANNDQIVQGISVGVAKAMMAVNKDQPSSVVIEATGDTSGLLNFITFEQKKVDKQYGL